MPKSTFTGVRLQLVGNVAVTVSYPDVVSMETFMKMKEACDAVTQPELVPEDKGASNSSRKGDS